MNQAGYLSRTQEYGLAATTAVVTANAYYIHPIIGEVARDFGVDAGSIGLVPALNQIALAVGIFLLLPLGDRYSNRSLCITFVSLQTIAMLGMAIAAELLLFTLASTLLGFVTIAPYLLPAFASKRVAPERLGQVTALLTAGVIFGILVARVGAGIVAEYFSWRAVFWIAAGLMVAVTLLLPVSMRSETHVEKRPKGSYAELLLSVVKLAQQHREVLLSAAIQALNFAMFTATWLALALHLTSPELGYGVDVVGYLAGIAAVSILSTPRIGRWADRVGARKARVVLAALQLVGTSLLYPFGVSAVAILVPLIIVNLVGPGVDVTGRMTFLSLAPEIRTRLTTIYIVVMFVGGGLGSILGTASYDWGGWAATCAMIVGASLLNTALAFCAFKRWA
ncbi:MFS transporter [Altererythrobacter sp.]|uniref:MFS transporter n=1 Tax=Altererythrobacter sp. TaxID=1872480 RepID=UPI001B08D139|nr:MFS transporter [Altererythrobacter sp.]MBO6608290.1 MFS transporter [Altererythrobacter sp.]MBO6641454.1 MFS transporter [Altererythrobacter sp.]MBO6707847.1 MFS transporter [Altererythrobacter sp.]MBO6946021.1 MFS transporter [Altererythrobacter sp.]